MDKELSLELTSNVQKLEIDILKILEQLGIDKDKWLNISKKHPETDLQIP